MFHTHSLRHGTFKSRLLPTWTPTVKNIANSSLKVLVLEARSYTGGRVHTITLDDFKDWPLQPDAASSRSSTGTTARSETVNANGHGHGNAPLKINGHAFLDGHVDGISNGHADGHMGSEDKGHFDIGGTWLHGLENHPILALLEEAKGRKQDDELASVGILPVSTTNPWTNGKTVSGSGVVGADSLREDKEMVVYAVADENGNEKKKVHQRLYRAISPQEGFGELDNLYCLFFALLYYYCHREVYSIDELQEKAKELDLNRGHHGSEIDGVEKFISVQNVLDGYLYSSKFYRSMLTDRERGVLLYILRLQELWHGNDFYQMDAEIWLEMSNTFLAQKVYGAEDESKKLKVIERLFNRILNGQESLQSVFRMDDVFDFGFRKRELTREWYEKSSWGDLKGPHAIASCGMGSLVQKLLAIDPNNENVNLKLNTEVTKIDSGTSSAKQLVSCKYYDRNSLNGGVCKAKATFVLVTLPISLIVSHLEKNTLFAQRDFDEDNLAKIKAVKMGSYFKVFLKFKRCFWDDQSSFFGITPTGSLELSDKELRETTPFCFFFNYFKFTKQPVLVATASGDIARSLEGKCTQQSGFQEVVRLALEGVKNFAVPMQNGNVVDCEKMLEKFYVTSWQQEKFSQGTYPSAVNEVIDGPLGPKRNIFLAGDAIALNGGEGSIAAAFDSGETQARIIYGLLQKPSWNHS